MHFYDFDFTDDMLDSLDAMRFDQPTPVQEQTIPVIMDGHDLIACAQTGTGKTAAYLLPTIDAIVCEPHKGIDTVILVPTRELAQQIDQQMEGFGYFVSVSSTAVYGGSDRKEWSRQEQAIKGGADIVITTPGRMLQHLSMGYVDFSNVRHLILDEADRMLDMGFFDDIMQVIKAMPTEGRQTLMFSATMPPKIRELAKTILVDPVEISIAIAKPAEGIRQAAYVVYEPQKPALVDEILKAHQGQSIIIFGSRKQSVKDLGRTLSRKGYKVGTIHSDLEQDEREDVLRLFRNRGSEILVATDIIARGIDIPDVDVVINYDVPRDAEDYVHRIGRTARAQSKGEAFTLIVPAEMFSFGKIEQLIEKEVEKLALPEGFGDAPVYDPKKRVERQRGGKGGSNGGSRHSGRHSGREGADRHRDGANGRQRGNSHRNANGATAPAEGAAPSAEGAQPAEGGNRRKNNHRHKSRKPKTDGSAPTQPEA